jgi:hypothetical protein
MSDTPRLSLPFLSVGQSQKEFVHNEALQTLDLLVGGAVEEPPRTAPPTVPALGACYIVDGSATDVWAGKDGCVAGWTSGGWRFVEPLEGMRFLVRTTGIDAMFREGAWELGEVRASALVIGDQQVVGDRVAAIASPSGGTTIDGEARTAVSAILAALRAHGLIES